MRGQGSIADPFEARLSLLSTTGIGARRGHDLAAQIHQLLSEVRAFDLPLDESVDRVAIEAGAGLIESIQRAGAMSLPDSKLHTARSLQTGGRDLFRRRHGPAN